MGVGLCSRKAEEGRARRKEHGAEHGRHEGEWGRRGVGAGWSFLLAGWAGQKPAGGLICRLGACIVRVGGFLGRRVVCIGQVSFIARRVVHIARVVVFIGRFRKGRVVVQLGFCALGAPPWGRPLRSRVGAPAARRAPGPLAQRCSKFGWTVKTTNSQGTVW